MTFHRSAAINLFVDLSLGYLLRHKLYLYLVYSDNELLIKLILLK